MSTTSEFFQKWIDVILDKLCILLHWPTKETLQMTIHQFFKEQYPRTCCVIDSSKIFTEPSCAYMYQERVKIYSNDDKQNSVEFLFGITTSALSVQHNQDEATLLGVLHCHMQTILFHLSAPT